jgi:hypothetical protein
MTIRYINRRYREMDTGERRGGYEGKIGMEEWKNGCNGTF